MSRNPLTQSPPPAGPIDLGVLASELDGGLASRAAIGLVVLATDQTMEHEFRVLIHRPDLTSNINPEVR